MPRDFRLLWWAAALSNFGSMVRAIALPLVAVVGVLEATPAQLAWLLAAGLLPGVLLGLQAGAWVDRVRKRPLLVASDLGRALRLGTGRALPAAGTLGSARPLG